MLHIRILNHLQNIAHPAKRMVVFTIAVCAVIALLASCSDDDDKTATEHDLIPLALGNQWIYADSIYTDTGVQYRVDTVEITGSRTSNDTVWWKFSKPFNFTIVANEFAVNDGMIYSLQHTDSPRGITGIISKEYVIPPSSPFKYQSLNNGDALIEKTVAALDIVSNYVGTPQPCFEYTYRAYPYEVQEVVCQGSGMILLRVSYMSTAGNFAGRVLSRKIQKLNLK